MLVPRDSFREDGPAVRAARKLDTAVAECCWNGHEVALDIKYEGKLASARGQDVQKARADDVALVLHTSGTTGRPKAVGSPEKEYSTRAHHPAGPFNACKLGENDA